MVEKNNTGNLNKTPSAVCQLTSWLSGLPCRSDNNDANHDEGELLGPHGHVHVHPQPVDQDVEGFRDGVHLSNPVKQEAQGFVLWVDTDFIPILCKW